MIRGTPIMAQRLLIYLVTLVSLCQCKMNVLFLVADDMRPQLNCFLGDNFPSLTHPKMYTPNLDGLASKSLLLKRAYVGQPLCSPSRTSLLTGRRPDRTHVYNLETYFRDSGGNFITLPQYFKQNGYLSIGIGKIFHPGELASGYDDPISWSEPCYQPNDTQVYNPMENSWKSVSNEEIGGKLLIDQDIAEHAKTVLERVADKAITGEQPTFVAVGFHKPHLPFVFPEEFLRFYPKEDIHLPTNPYAPVDMPKVAWHSFANINNYSDIHTSGSFNDILPDDVVKNLRRAYYSAISFTDSLIGQVLTKLDEVGMTDNTIVSFWGDHGFHLGEHGEWGKQTNFELSTHAPMMIHIPGMTDNGIVTEQLTEFVDLFPTLVEATGLPTLSLCPEDSTSIQLCREGNSLMPLVRNSSRSDWKKRVFSQNIRDDDIMGYTMRTDLYRYTEWVKFKGKPTYKPIWESVVGVELYDHRFDPEENINKANSGNYQSIRLYLRRLLHLGWRHANV